MVLQTKSTVIILLICCIVAISCNPGNKNIPLVSIDVQAMPIMHTEGSSGLISQSGGIVHLDAKISQIFSNDNDSYLFYPEKIHVERLDSLFQVDGELVADTAYYYDRKELWHVIGNVVVKNAEGTVFKTPELFWDPKVPSNKLDAFYTNKPVKIVKSDGTILDCLNGFTADQSLIHMRYFSGKANLHIIESTDTLQQDSISRDTPQQDSTNHDSLTFHE